MVSVDKRGDSEGRRTTRVEPSPTWLIAIEAISFEKSKSSLSILRRVDDSIEEPQVKIVTPGRRGLAGRACKNKGFRKSNREVQTASDSKKKQGTGIDCKQSCEVAETSAGELRNNKAFVVGTVTFRDGLRAINFGRRKKV